MNIKTLKAINAAIGRNTRKLPILNCFYIDNEYLYVSRFDIMVRTKHHFPLQENSAPIVIDADVFIPRIATIEAPYQINVNGEKVEFVSGDNLTTLPNNSKDDFPKNLLLYNYTKLFTLQWNEIRLMNIAKEFVSDDELRPVMGSVCVSQDHIVASDAHKLYYRKIYPKSELDILIDPKVIKLMMLTNGSNFDISCHFDFFKAENEEMAIYWHSCQNIKENLIDTGKYPSWRKILPSNTKSITIPVKEFLNAITSLKFAYNPYSGLLVCDIKADTMDLLAENLDEGIKASEKIRIFNKDNHSLRFGAKSQFLKEILSLFNDEGYSQITMSFSDETHAFVFGDMMLLMPMMIHD